MGGCACAILLERRTPNRSADSGSLPGMLRVTVNSRTGSLLLEYDPTRSAGGLVGPCRAVGGFRLAQDEHDAPEAALRPGQARAIRFTNRGMATLGVLAFGLAGRERGMSWREGCSSSSTWPISIPRQRPSSRPRRTFFRERSLATVFCKPRPCFLRLHPGAVNHNGPSAPFPEPQRLIQEVA